MTYKRKCERCDKSYHAKRPHSRFCGKNCRVGSFNFYKRKDDKIKQLQDKLKDMQTKLADQESKILNIEKSLNAQETAVEQILQYQQNVEKSKSVSFISFCVKYQHKEDPITKKIVPALILNDEAGTARANLIFEERQKRLNSIHARHEITLGEYQVEINNLQSALQKEKEELEAIQEALQQCQMQLALLLMKEKKGEVIDFAVKDHLPSVPLVDQSIGAEDLLNKQIITFKLPGTVGEFLGELERHMLAIALVGDAGAGKSTLMMTIARAFDLAGYKIIFYSLELGIAKPLQDMIRLSPLSNQVRIVDKGNISTVRESAKKFDLVMVDSFGKLGCKAEEWDRLRQDFPNTMFLFIFQKTTSGSSRGGASVDYDASMVINVTNDKASKKRVAHMRKSRYGTQGWSYFPEDDVVVNV